MLSNNSRYLLNLILVLFVAFKLSAQDPYYVSALMGNDSNVGTIDAPFETINRGIAAVSAGGTVYVMNGEYKDNTNNYVAPSVSFYEDVSGGGDSYDTSGKPYVDSNSQGMNNDNVVTISKSGNLTDGYITIKNYPNHTPKIIFDGKGGILIGKDDEGNGVNYVIVEGFEVEGPSQSINYTQAIMNRRNRVTLKERDGILNNNYNYFTGKGIWGGYDPHSHVIIKNNIVHDTPGSGIRFNKSDHITVENNTVYNTTWWTSSASSAIVFAETIAATADDNTNDIKMIMRGNIVYNNWNRIPFFMASKPANSTPPSEDYGNAQYSKILDGQGLYVTRSHTPDPDPSKGDQRPAYAGTFLFENNLCVNNGKNGINFDRSTHSSALIRNNTIYFNGVHEIIQDISENEGNLPHRGQKVAGIIANFVYKVTVVNNIVVTRYNDYSALKLNNVDDPETVDDPTTDETENDNDGIKIATNNIFVNGTVAYPGNQVSANQINVDPLFVSVPTLADNATTIAGWAGYLDGTDFSLQQSSPAINTGSSDYSPTKDILGNPRPIVQDNSDVISSSSFEIGKDGWYNFGNITVAQSTETAKTGSKSLKTSGRTLPYNSPRIDLNNLLTVGEAYAFYVWVKLAEGNGTAQLTVKSTVNGATSDDNIDTYKNSELVTATTNGWVRLSLNYTHTQNDQSFLYVKGPEVSNEQGVDYFIDDFSLVTQGTNEVDFSTAGNIVDIGAYEYQAGLSITDNPMQANAVYAYPNPTKDILTLINLTEHESIAVYDVLGRKQTIQQQRNPNRLKLNVSNLKRGLYFINVTNNNGNTKAIRFIKK